MKKILPIIITAVVVGGACFYGGLKYQQNVNTQTIAAQRAQRTAGLDNFGTGTGQRNGTQRMAGGAGGFTGGQIISKDAQSITVKSSDGSSKIVFFSDTTKIMKSAESSSDDLVTGEQVTINGAANPDGSITAQTIQLRPATSTP